MRTTVVTLAALVGLAACILVAHVSPSPAARVSVRTTGVPGQLGGISGHRGGTRDQQARRPEQQTVPSGQTAGSTGQTAGSSGQTPGGSAQTAGSSAEPTGTPAQQTTGGQAVPATIVADCSADVTAALNRWMASVPDGSTLRFGAGACYRVDGTLVLPDRHDLTLDGNGATFAASVVPAASPKITRQMWYVLGGSGITFSNMAVRGTNSSATYDENREWLPLIQIAGTRGVLVQGVHGSHSWGDFVSIGPDVRRDTNSDGTGAVLPSGVTVRNSTASDIGRHGVTCNGCDDVVVDRNVFSDVAYQILDIEVEAATWHARNITFTGNTIGGTVHHSVLANAGIGHDVTGITVAGNTVTGSPVTCAPAVQVDDTTAVKRNFVITGNRFKTLGNAFWLRGVSDVTAADNVVPVGNAGCQNAGVAVVATDGGGSVLQNNDFSGATKLLDSGTSAFGTACGNRLAGTGFDQPQACRTS